MSADELQQAIDTLDMLGCTLQLWGCNTGKWKWMAIALGENPEMNNGHAAYTRACGFGDVYIDAVRDLLKNMGLK